MGETTQFQFEHLPVMPKEVFEDLALTSTSIAVDVTAGGGGHLALMAKAIGPNGRVIGLDRDLRAHQLDAAGGVAKEYAPYVKLFHAPFSELPDVLASEGIEQIDALLCDLGVSSPQLDDADRGFSFMRDGPLDMRMDSTSGLTAYQLIEQTSEEDLANIIFNYGEERLSRRIARSIKKRWPIPDSTLALANLIAGSVGGKRGRIHPATRTFQALRIAVNHELDELDSLLTSVFKLLAPKGRAVFISFHSLEDRRIKQAFKKAADKSSGKTPEWRILHKKPLQASDEEIEINPRARSAKLRTIEKLDSIGIKYAG
jgi:16S rRNA (cytosine1402-N4)-methyltransferase